MRVIYTILFFVTFSLGLFTSCASSSEIHEAPPQEEQMPDSQK